MLKMRVSMSNYRRFFSCLAVLLLAGLLSLPAAAEEQQPPAPAGDPLTVTDVLVDRTDKNAVEAREQAIVEAQRLAFQKFAERFMSPEVFKAYQMPDDKAIAVLVRDFQIKKEQISARRYVASFTVRFTPEAQDYIRAAGGGGTAVFSPVEAGPELAADGAPPAMGERTILVLPYLRDLFGKTVLWEDPNPWREIWQASGNVAAPGGFSIVVPSGDIADIAQGSSDAVWSRNYSVVEKLRAGYNANEVVLAVANKAGAYLQADLYVYKGGRLERAKSLEPYAGDDALKTVFGQAFAWAADAARLVKTLPEVPAGAADDAPPPLDASAQPGGAADQVLPSQKLRLEAVMDFSGFPQWVEAQNRLSAAAPGLLIEISSLSRRSARFTIAVEWPGGVDAFRDALAEKGLALEKTAEAAPLYILRMN